MLLYHMICVKKELHIYYKLSFGLHYHCSGVLAKHHASTLRNGRTMNIVCGLFLGCTLKYSSNLQVMLENKKI